MRNQKSPDDPERLGPPEDPEAVARKILLDQLTGRARSRADLAAKLAGKDVPEEIAHRLRDRFEELGAAEVEWDQEST
jgi:regulatory protein